MKKCIGVLGLQGGFALHKKSLEELGHDAPIIRWSQELSACDALIIPGGESTTVLKLLSETGLDQSIQEFASDHPIMGTCAGLIILSSKVSDAGMKTLALIEMEVQRNGFGRQVDSFIDRVDTSSIGIEPSMEGIFIRAPKILSLGHKSEAIGYLGNEVVMARNKRILAMTFHPELTNDLRIHKYFIDNFL